MVAIHFSFFNSTDYFSFQLSIKSCSLKNEGNKGFAGEWNAADAIQASELGIERDTTNRIEVEARRLALRAPNQDRISPLKQQKRNHRAPKRYIHQSKEKKSLPRR